MTSLHVICGLGYPIKNPGYAYDQGRVLTQIMRSGSLLKQRLYPFGHAAEVN